MQKSYLYICVAFSRRNMYMPICSTVQLNIDSWGMQIWTYIDTNSGKLNQVKIVIIICQTSNQSATMEQNYCSSKSIF